MLQLNRLWFHKVEDEKKIPIETARASMQISFLFSFRSHPSISIRVSNLCRTKIPNHMPSRRTMPAHDSPMTGFLSLSRRSNAMDRMDERGGSDGIAERTRMSLRKRTDHPTELSGESRGAKAMRTLPPNPSPRERDLASLLSCHGSIGKGSEDGARRRCGYLLGFRMAISAFSSRAPQRIGITLLIAC